MPCSRRVRPCPQTRTASGAACWTVWRGNTAARRAGAAPWYGNPIHGSPRSCCPTGSASAAGAGGQRIAYFQQLAALLGLSIHVTEYKPFLTGLSRCGQRLNGDHDVRFVWSVVVRGQRVLRFRCGASVPGERLLDFARREDLECLLRLYAPAHTVLIIGYEE